MRLTEQQIEIIKSEILRYDSQAIIYLLGSRVDDKKPFTQIALSEGVRL